MKAKLLIRISAFLILVHLLGHSVGHSTWDKPEDQKMQEVVQTMKSYKGEFMGAKQSMADYYHGYSLILFGLYAMTILILWFVSSELENISLTKKIMYVIGITYIFFGVIEFIYFFLLAASVSFLAGVLTLAATFLNKGRS